MKSLYAKHLCNILYLETGIKVDHIPEGTILDLFKMMGGEAPCSSGDSLIDTSGGWAGFHVWVACGAFMGVLGGWV